MGMHILLLCCWLLLGSAGMAAIQNFAYAPGKCEIAISEVFQSMVGTSLGNVLRTRPTLPQSELLHYDLYTPLNPETRQFLRPGDVSMLMNSYFNPNWPVRVSIHGWTGQSTSCSNAAIKDAYLSRGNFNVIILDWSRQSMDISYQRVSRQLPAIAAEVAKMLRFLHDTTGVSYDQIYLVGHSAGTHISGLTGKAMRPDRLGAIIALDPAGLTQLRLGPEERLDANDATYVESIHTDLTLLGNPSTTISQASFFVNWGLGQPQCPNATATEFDFACDHFAAIFYFAESVRNPRSFPALGCHSAKEIYSATCTCNIGAGQTCPGDVFMGGEPAVPKRGIYYLSTRKHSPFGSADNLVHIKRPVPSNYRYIAKRKLKFP